MRKTVGSIRVLELGTTLQYSIFGSRQEGYGIEIVKKEKDGSVIKNSQSNITYYVNKIRWIARLLMQGSVFAGSLQEILQELEILPFSKVELEASPF